MRLFQFTTANIPSILSLAGSDDRLLLRQDAVYLLLTSQQWPCPVLVLQADLLKRGLICPANVSVIDDTQWVELVIAASQVISCQS